MTVLTRDLDAHYPLTEQAIARFQRDGHIHLREVLSAETLARAGARISALVAERANRQPMAARGVYGRAFQQIINLWTIDAVAREFVFSRRLARLAAELMGCQGVRLYHDQALYKEPGGGYTPWHSDQSHWPLTPLTTCTAWVPFQDVPVEMGPVAFAAGSHRADFGRHLYISEESERVIARRVTDLPLVEEPFALGDVSFHYGWTFHRAPPNRTSQLRGVMTIIYFEDGMRLAQPATPQQQMDWDQWCPGAVVGEIVDTPLNPVLYRAEP